MLQVPDWNIWYRTSNNRKITLKDDESYTVTSHTYSNGLGKIKFKSNYGTRYVYIAIKNQTNLTHIYFGNGFQYDGGIAGATNLQHIQLPNREGVSDMENQILEIGGNLRTIVYDDEWGGDTTYLLNIFENPYANAMVVTLFVPNKEVNKYSGTWFKVKPIDYQPEGSDKKIQLLEDHKVIEKSVVWGSYINLDELINLPSDYTGIRQYKATPSTFVIKNDKYLFDETVGYVDHFGTVSVSLEDDEKYKGVSDKLIARITFKMP